MSYKTVLPIIFFTAACCAAFAGTPATEASGDSAARADLYKSAGVVLLVWAGIAFYLFFIDRKISGLEKEIDEK